MLSLIIMLSIVGISAIAIICILFRITWLRGYQKGIEKGRDICLAEFRKVGYGQG